jgi:hypothetical protein
VPLSIVKLFAAVDDSSTTAAVEAKPNLPVNHVETQEIYVASVSCIVQQAILASSLEAQCEMRPVKKKKINSLYSR